MMSSVAVRWITIIGILGAVLSWLLFPLDISWVSDTSVLISIALQKNAEGTLATCGLGAGSGGIFYGPLPIWFYQAVLAVTRDLAWVVWIKVAVCGAFTVLPCIYLVRALNLPLQTMWLLTASPFLYLYTRSLWDNVMLIPLSALLLAAFVRFLKSRDSFALGAVILSTILMVQIHLLSLFLTLPVLCFCLWEVKTNRDRVVHNLKWAAAATVVGVCLSYPYLHDILSHDLGKRSHGPSQIFASLWHVLSASRFFSPSTLLALAAPKWLGVFPLVIAVALGWGLLTLSGWGMWVEAKLLRWKRARREAFTLENKLSACFFCVMAITWVGLSVMRVGVHPHYWNATWFIPLYFIGKGAVTLFSVRTGQAVLAMLSGFSFFVLLWWMTTLHAHQGDVDGVYGPTLGRQLRAVCEKTGENFPTWKQFPNDRETLRSFCH